MILNFNRIIPEEDLIGRIMGPDSVSPTAFVYVYSVVHSPEGKEGKTVALCRPLPLDENRVVRDDWRQPRVAF